jgi:Flp pilus assembly protein protease CpaA
MGSLAIQASRIDAQIFRLPNRLTAGVFVTAIFCVMGWSRVVPREDGILMVLTWVTITGLHVGLSLLSNSSLGMGDAKLIAGLSLPLIWWGSVLNWLTLAYCSAAIVGMATKISGKSRRIAFGPHLTGGWILLLVGQLSGVAMAYSR